MSGGSREEERDRERGRERADSKDNAHRRSVRFTTDTVSTEGTLQVKSHGEEISSPDQLNNRKIVRDREKEKKEKEKEKEREDRRREKIKVRERERIAARRPTRARRKVYKDERPPVVVEIDEETDVDMIAVLHDWSAPIGIEMVNIGFVPGSGFRPVGDGRTITVLLRKKMSQAAKQYRLKTTESSRNEMLLPVLNLAGILTALFKVDFFLSTLFLIFLSSFDSSLLFSFLPLLSSFIPSFPLSYFISFLSFFLISFSLCLLPLLASFACSLTYLLTSLPHSLLPSLTSFLPWLPSFLCFLAFFLLCFPLCLLTYLLVYFLPSLATFLHSLTSFLGYLPSLTSLYASILCFLPLLHFFFPLVPFFIFSFLLSFLPSFLPSFPLSFPSLTSFFS